jgi:glycosyltransferase involved in cell wall biosynthesis
MHRSVSLVRIFSRLNVGGPSVHVILLSAGLSGLDYQTTLVLGREDAHEGNMNYLAERYGVRPVILPCLGREISLLNDLRATFALWRLLKKTKPLIVHTHTSKAGFSGRLAARMAGIPVLVHTFHGHVLRGYFGPFKTWLLTALERGLARWTDAIVTVSRAVKADLVALGVAEEAKFHVIELGLDLQPFLSLSGRSGVLRNACGIEETLPLVGIVGRLVPIKDHETFLTAAALVRRSGQPAFFAVIGDGELRQHLESRAFELGLGDSIKFFGWRTDLADVYADLDLVVLSSRNEGTPVSLIEAAAAGKPVVATAVGGIPDFIQHGSNGYLVPPGDSQALAAAISMILADPARAGALGTWGRKMVSERFATRRLLADHHQLYVNLLKNKGIKLQHSLGDDDAKVDE